ncbi:MAG TPA: CHASE domain-containing protein, partial [Burkholderiaceae bacterium]|nr:CHASE domain-containing protein [Burkholderiaceae bacterium]
MLRQYRLYSLSFGALLGLLLGLILTAMLFVAARGSEHDKNRLDFEQRAEARIEAVRSRLQWSINELLSVNRLFVTFGTVSREQFHSFTRPLLERNPYIQAFNFHRIISHQQRAAFEAGVQDYFPGFAIRELAAGKLVAAARRAQYRPVDYIEPLEGNEEALGFDAASYSFQSEALERAVVTGQPSATGLLSLMQERHGQSGLIVLMPVYRRGAATDSAQARRQALIGDTAAVFRMADLVERVLAAEAALDAGHTRVSLYLQQSEAARKLAYRSDGMELPNASGWLESLLYAHPQPLSKSFDIGGQLWNMTVAAAPDSFRSLRSDSLLVLLGGLLTSVLGCFYLQSLVRRTRDIQRLVRRRTAELRLANRYLRRDIAARVHAEQALQLRQRAIEASANAIVIVSAEAPDYPIEYVNPAFERNSGFAANEILGRTVRALRCDERDQQAIAEIRAALLEQREGKAVLRNLRKDGSIYWSEFYVSPVFGQNATVSHFVLAQYDITAAKNYEAELEFQAGHDHLTGLANRNLVRDRLQQAISYADSYGHAVWLVHVDLDQFKFINDALGHPAGDALLRTLADRLKQGLRSADTVARVNGDEFLLVFIDDMEQETCVAIMQRVMQLVAVPLKI